MHRIKLQTHIILAHMRQMYIRHTYRLQGGEREKGKTVIPAYKYNALPLLRILTHSYVSYKENEQVIVIVLAEKWVISLPIQMNNA